jgi:hypothetical protein
VIVATGEADSGRDEAIDAFGFGSTRRKTIGLCSDSLSEGVNLQQASALIHLDMPTVVRIAEQRVGRVDRMDSPHEVIEAWWPDDAREFALSTDERFIERYETVDRLLGSNMPLPEEMQEHAISENSRETVDTKQLIQELERQSEQGAWDGIKDAFEPVRELVEGSRALVTSDVYKRYRRISVRVLSRVSVVRSATPWAFFCLTGGSFGAPRWIVLLSLKEPPITDLGAVCEALRQRLNPEIQSLKLGSRGASLLEQFLKRLDEAEQSLLPRRKQRALEEMRFVIKKLAQEAGSAAKQSDVEHLDRIIKMLDRDLREFQPDWDAIAGRWLDVIRPVWFEMLNHRQRRRPLLLKEIRAELLKRGDWLTEQIVERFQEIPVLPVPEERIKACIIGCNELVRG